MKKVIIALASLALAAITANAQMIDIVKTSGQYQMIGVGIRGGMGSLQQDGFGLERTPGFNGGVDGVYGFYFANNGTSKAHFGIRTGLGFGFTKNNVTKSDYTFTYPSIEHNGEKMTYTVNSSKMEESNSQMSLEIPIMASVMRKQIYMNLGVRIGIPVMSKYDLTMVNPEVDVKLENYDVHLKNVKALGSFTSATKSGDLEASTFNLGLAFETGYTMEFGGSWINAGIYLDLGLVNTFESGKTTMIDVDFSTLDAANNTPATLTVNSLTQSHADKMGNMSFGVRFLYSWPKIKGKR